METEELVWAEKYRPMTVDECILPDRIKNKFKQFVEDGDISSNLVLSGTPGVGKTTVALACVKEIDAEYLLVNASMKGNIDTLRYKVEQFVTKMAFNFKRKYVIFDESEGLTAETQKGIRGFIEEYSKYCGFIFTCNDNTLHDAIQSRTIDVSFNFSADERRDLLKRFTERVFEILKSEKVKYNKKDVVNFIIHNKSSLDFRNLIIQLQYAANKGEINYETLKDTIEEDFNNLVSYLKDKKYESAREWIHEHPEYSPKQVRRKLYDTAKSFLTKDSVPMLVLIINKYDFQSNFSVDQDINMDAMFVDCMVDLEFK